MTLLNSTKTALIGMLLSGVSLAAAQTSSKALDLEKVPDVALNPCSDQDKRQVVNTSETASVLSNYGLDVRAGLWKCTTLLTPWLKNSKVFSLQTISAQVDTGEDVAILSVGHEPRLWVIPISSGMVGYPNVRDDIHNRAAFNAILAGERVLPHTKEMWVSLSVFYMNLVGTEIHVADWKAHGEAVHGLASSPDFFHKKSLLPSVECQGDQCTVTVNDTRVTSTTKNLTTWVFIFTTVKDRAIMLDSVEYELKALSELP